MRRVLSAEYLVLRKKPVAPNAGRPKKVRSEHSELRTKNSALRTISFATLILLIAPELSACAVCWGAPDDPMVKGANNGIWLLLGVVAFVQLGFVAMFWSFWRRARELRRFRESLRLIEGGPHA